MCWVAVDRAITLADHLDANDRVDHWKQAREEISDAILTEGWSDAAGAFTQSFGSDELDASNLMMAIVGFLPASDSAHPRDDRRHRRPSHRRSRTRLPLPGPRRPRRDEEGTFLLCTFWLAQALALTGELDRATETMERAVAFANDLGLLAEEVDAATGELLGNFPQAFSHIGLVNAAWAIAQARQRAGVL